MKRILFILSLICLSMFVGCSTPSNNVEPSKSSEDIKGDYVGTLSSTDGSSSILMGATFLYKTSDSDFELDLRIKDGEHHRGTKYNSETGPFYDDDLFTIVDDNTIRVDRYHYESKVYSGVLNKR